MNKILSFSILVIFLLIFSGCDNLFDNSHDNISIRNVRSVTLDPITDCDVEQVHQHNGEYYSGHYNNDSHGHHGLTADNTCVLQNCQETGLHQHNGTHYAGHNNSCNHGGNEHHGNGYN